MDSIVAPVSTAHPRLLSRGSSSRVRCAYPGYGLIIGIGPHAETSDKAFLGQEHAVMDIALSLRGA